MCMARHSSVAGLARCSNSGTGEKRKQITKKGIGVRVISQIMGMKGRSKND